MSKCPTCGTEFIPGIDQCEECGNSLTHLYLKRPALSAAEGLLVDRLKKLQPAPPICVPPEAPTGEVLKTLAAAKIGCVLINDEAGCPIGIFSERDALMRIDASEAGFRDRPISDFMTPNPRTLQAKNRIAFAVQRMDLGGFRHVPIVDEEGKTTGIVSVRDILRYMTTMLTEEDVA